jgi:mono/diheme cytochrome c family protein
MNLLNQLHFLGRHIVRSLVSVLLVLVSAGAVLPQDKRALESRGEGLLTTNCSRCHAVGRTGNSTHPQAPTFRTLGQRYPIEVLAEALAEGLSSGHPDMPEFRFEIDDVDAILAYLESIQESRQGAPPAAK